MRQHAAAKAAHPDCVVFFRLGDFYEMFGDDAVLVSEELDLTLTSRNKGKPDEVPMAGVPHHSAHSYISRLLAKGHKVAICEQMADPSTVKGIVPRQVVRVITAGTWRSDEEEARGDNQWLCALEAQEEGVGVAFLDLGTAELLAAEVDDFSGALAELRRIGPAEILLHEGDEARALKQTLTSLFSGVPVRQDEELSDASRTRALAGVTLGDVGVAAQRAAARTLRYARHCYQGREFPVWRIAQLNPSGFVGLDLAAQRHLELVESTVGDERATLLSIVDRTCSKGGARLLRRRLLSPLTDIEAISRRLDAVEIFVGHPKIRAIAQKALSRVGDLERLAVRGSAEEATPRDLGNVCRGLHAASELVATLEALPEAAKKHAFGLEPDQVDLVADLERDLALALVDRPPVQLKEGAVFRQGFDEELDQQAELRKSGSEQISTFEAALRIRTQIANLRVKFTRVFGWYVEVSRTSLAKVPSSFVRKQTVAGGERYTLPELDELAEALELAEARYRARELELLAQLNQRLSCEAHRVHRLAAWLSLVDVAASLAQVAAECDYCRPTVDSSDVLEIQDGRHPVVERLAAEGRFVPNDVALQIGGTHLWLISGPNMAGKSTFLRQVALTVILAQMGSFVPARSARIGLVDRVLSRVGASDNLAGGESTFMVEMRETASILRQATRRSLVILDEVGRGTSTFDGLAIAWAVAEHLDESIGCRTLFATHYHELTALAEGSRSAANHCVTAQEHQGDVIFLHRVTAGAASRSYGVAVAQLAGLPETVLARSRAVLAALESGQHLDQRPPQSEQPEPQPTLLSAHLDTIDREIARTLAEVDPERLTGLQALQLLHQLSERAKKR